MKLPADSQIALTNREDMEGAVAFEKNDLARRRTLEWTAVEKRAEAALLAYWAGFFKQGSDIETVREHDLAPSNHEDRSRRSQRHIPMPLPCQFV
ncbi:hypothetical protein [Rhizobium sp. IBUN]|uniref:hypothetical protein n=1 Tax=Rhizobium sp. IBUN TaxID=1042326 RepID=UPI0004124291|nr:hypothetical protein [Rhizobium sp. IBUN]